MSSTIAPAASDGPRLNISITKITSTPTFAVSGTALLEMERSACADDSVSSVSSLFASTGSNSFANASAANTTGANLLDNVSMSTVTDLLTSAPDAKLNPAHVTTPASTVPPSVADMNVICAGSVASASTLVASDGPRFSMLVM